MKEWNPVRSGAVEAVFDPVGAVGAVAGVVGAAVGFAADDYWVGGGPTWVQKDNDVDKQDLSKTNTFSNLWLYKHKQIQHSTMIRVYYFLPDGPDLYTFILT